MSISLQQFIERFEQYAPPTLAYEWDRPGIHFGSKKNRIDKIMVTLDVRPAVVQEAIAKNVDLIFAHHPPIFKPIQRFDVSDPQTKMYADIIQHSINVYAAHTNLDIVENGLNDWLAEALRLQNIEVLAPTEQVELLKLVVFVPRYATEQLKQALFRAGAGQFSNEYSDCAFTVSGIGQFKPQGHANPTIGQIDRFEFVEEDRIELIVPMAKQQAVLQALQANHPYEQPAYDLIALKNYEKTVGIGRVGELQNNISLAQMIELVQNNLMTHGLRVVKPENYTDQPIKRVAICGGSGSDFYQFALKQKADVYITGDVSYHTAHDLQAHQLLTIDAGHYIERICVNKLISLFNQWNDDNHWGINVIASATETDPFEYYI